MRRLGRQLIAARSGRITKTREALLLAATALLLAGCTGAGGSPESSATAIPDDWNLTPADMENQYDEFLAELVVKYGLDEPIEADPVRFVSADEWAMAHVNCVTEKGFPASVGAQGGVTYGDIPAEQGLAQRRAAASCEAEYPIDPRYSMQLPRNPALAQYGFLVDTVAPCVEAQGYAISTPPSESTWLDEYYATGQAWDPFDEAASQIAVGSDDLDDLYRACPPLSDDVYPPAAP